MKPRRPSIEDRQGDWFRVELCRIVDPGHPMVKLAQAVDWDRMDEVFGATFCPDNGRPGVSTRLMVSLHFLKY
ncbi:MAG: IS5/IS1182 family transposase, partial [Pseudomonadota bacterium]